MADHRWTRPRKRLDAAGTARFELVALLSGPRVDGAVERGREEIPRSRNRDV
jgi:hypothetical protein